MDSGLNARLRLARGAVLVVFFVHGAVFASWAARIPAVQERLVLSPGLLGIVLAGPALGALAGSQAGGRLVDVVGSRAISALAPVILCLPLGLIPLASSPWQLTGLLLALGAADGTTAVAMNAQAVAVQDRYGRPVLNGMHAGRSIGAVIGGLGGAAMVLGGLPLSAQFPLSAAVLAVISALAAGWLLPSRRRTLTSPSRSKHGNWFAVGLLALLTFLAALVEDAPASWGGVYLRSIGAAGSVAAAGYGVFSAGEVVGRLYSDRLVARVGWTRLIRAGTLACALAFTAALLLGRVEVTLVALAVAGLGISTVFPGAFAGAGSIRNVDGGVAMAQVNFAGNVGWLAVSPTIGGLATISSLPLALGLLPAAALAIAALASATEPEGAADRPNSS